MNTVNQATLNLIKAFEGLRLNAYPDPGTGNEPITIGIGTTIYPNGTKVKMGDKITEGQAMQFLSYDLTRFSQQIKGLLRQNINDNKFGAIVSFAYNVGLANLKLSTLLKKVNANPADASVRAEFMKWNKAAGKVLAGLTRRREAEANLYFS